ncbi:MAG TPA: dipeptidase PepE [Nannocystis sp.]|jgi:dipeptidase E
MSRLLLLSSSNVHGHGYLDHAEAELLDFLGPVKRLLFVPFALHDRDAYTAKVASRLAPLGIAVEGLHTLDDPDDARAAVAAAQAVFVGGGNTFRLLSEVYRLDIRDTLFERVDAGMPYIGSSAGTNLAGLTIGSSNDMPIVYPPSFVALGLVPFNFNPHYLDPDPHSTHKGETRETRIHEFHEHNHQPVLGLREPAMLRREGDRLVLRGEAGARLFRAGQEPVEQAPGADLSALLHA